MQAIPQSIALALFQAIPQAMLFHTVKSLLEIGSITFVLYVTYELGMFALAHAVERFWPEGEETSLLDKICGFGLDDNGVLHVGYAGSKEEQTGRIRFADRNEMVLFNYGMELRLKGASRRQIKKALKAVSTTLQSTSL